jgi:cytochrome c553
MGAGSVLAAMVRDALLRNAPHHEDSGIRASAPLGRTFRPHPEEPSEARHLEGWPQALCTILTISAFGCTSAHAAGDRELGQYLSSECVTCHQLSGRFQGIPPIIGWPDATFIEIMNEYRAKTRTNPVMQSIAGKFSQEEIAALAAYFGSLRPQAQ